MSKASHHDTFFKQMMSRTNNARAFLAQHLPPYALAVCDLSTLKQEKDSFVDPDLRNYCCDLLWSVRTKNHADSYIYCLLEHQSTPDPTMPLRIMRYALAVMYREMVTRTDSRKKLSAVIPLLFYTGKQKNYPGSLCWYDLFDDPEMMARIYSNPFPLINVSSISDDELNQHQEMLGLTEFLFKTFAASGDLAATGKRAGQFLAQGRRSGYTTDDDIIAVMSYVFRVGSADNHRAFVENLKQQMTQEQEKIMGIAMTIEEKIKWEGIALGEERGMALGEKKGRLEGKQEGRQEGKQEGRLEVARKMLNEGLPAEMVQKFTSLSDKELKALRT